ncbi:MAG: phosphatase PAP2 family protein, partial [Prevotella sp.]|nr:phosphatase PAP2 family protein [Prevotella sp.]
VRSDFARTDSIYSGRYYEFNLKRTILPLSLVGAGAVAIAPGFINRGSKAFTNAVLDIRGNRKRIGIDNYLQYLPVVGSLSLGLAGIKARHSFVDRTLITGVAYAALGILVNVPKALVDEKRPESSTHNSFPSGHTATAFMGAELVRIEYGSWYGAGAYAVAAGVGFLRLYNGKHRFNDVVAGAGIGIISARLGEWSYKLWGGLLERKAKNKFIVSPVIVPADGGYCGVAVCGYF